MPVRHLLAAWAAGGHVLLEDVPGTGKTTLAKAMLGLLEYERGEILVDGHSLKTIGAQQYRDFIGTVMQEDKLFAGTIADNIAFFATEIDLRRVEYCCMVAAIAINLLSTAAETRVGWRTRRRMWRSLGRALREPDVPDPIEREALQVAYRYYAWGGDEDRVQQAIEDLSRFLDE